MKIQGEFQLQLKNSDSGKIEFDSGWTKNIVTDFGRRLLVTSGWSIGQFNLFISQCTNPSNVRLNLLQNTYTSQSPSQLLSPSSATNDSTILLQTRFGTFTQPASSRTISIVGLCSASSLTGNAVYGIVAYTKLSTPVTQGTTQVADLQYRVTWSA